MDIENAIRVFEDSIGYIPLENVDEYKSALQVVVDIHNRDCFKRCSSCSRRDKAYNSDMYEFCTLFQANIRKTDVCDFHKGE